MATSKPVRGGRPRRRAGYRAASGIQADGSWVPEFEGQRKPFHRGNTLQLKHGAYVSPVRMGERAQELADLIRPHLPTYWAGVEPTLSGYAITLVRVERGAQAHEQAEAAGEEVPESLSRDLQRWIRLSVSLASELGLTPAGAARVLRDAAGGLASQAHAEILRQYRGAA